MKILVDADACPVKSIIEATAKKLQIPVIMFIDTSHLLSSDYAEIITVSKAADAVDFALINRTVRGDIVVTQDYGVAAMALGKGAYAIHPSGTQYKDETIERMLMTRHITKKAVRSHKKPHLKGPKKRTKEDDAFFESSFYALCIRALEH